MLPPAQTLAEQYKALTECESLTASRKSTPILESTDISESRRKNMFPCRRRPMDTPKETHASREEAEEEEEEMQTGN